MALEECGMTQIGVERAMRGRAQENRFRCGPEGSEHALVLAADDAKRASLGNRRPRGRPRGSRGAGPLTKFRIFVAETVHDSRPIQTFSPQTENPTGLPSYELRPDGLMINGLLPANGWEG